MAEPHLASTCATAPDAAACYQHLDQICSNVKQTHLECTCLTSAALSSRFFSICRVPIGKAALMLSYAARGTAMTRHTLQQDAPAATWWQNRQQKLAWAPSMMQVMLRALL